MSWMQRLVETYDACFGRECFSSGSDLLPPLCCVPQATQLHIVLWGDGTFDHAELSELENTPMFVTEDSAGRSGKTPAANPLTEQLEYCAYGMARYGGDSTKHDRYLELLSDWADSDWTDGKVSAVRDYVRAGTLLEDLLRNQTLSVADGELQKVRVGKNPVAPAKLWVRWTVNSSAIQSHTWLDPELNNKWAAFDQARARDRNLCMLSGQAARTTQKHPKRIRWGGDNAKLISANDDTGFTFRGRFTDSSHALTISYAETQKAHSVLRWLIARQGAKNGDQVIVAWSVCHASAAPVLADSLRFFTMLEEDEQDETWASSTPDSAHNSYQGDAGQNFALRLKAAAQGYGRRFSDTEGIVVIALDSATPGRMAILYYRELTGSEFLQRLERWHWNLAWPQNFGKARQFTGAPSPRDIAEAAYGGRADEKLRKATIERLLPCIIDGRPLPRDLVQATVRRAANRAGLERWEFERILGIACSLYRGSHPQEFPNMSLDESRLTRDYLYGRLLAVADDLEEKALWLAKANRSTNAARLMQRFADHPASTWLTLRKQINPYMVQMQSSSPGLLKKYKDLLDSVTARFNELPGGAEEFNRDSRLTGEFLLGFHSQREALRPRKISQSVSSETTAEEPEGDPSEQQSF